MCCWIYLVWEFFISVCKWYWSVVLISCSVFDFGIRVKLALPNKLS
jgi:hypothetical protein